MRSSEGVPRSKVQFHRGYIYYALRSIYTRYEVGDGGSEVLLFESFKIFKKFEFLDGKVLVPLGWQVSRFSSLGEGIFRDVFYLKNVWRGLHFGIVVRI